MKLTKVNVLGESAWATFTNGIDFVEHEITEEQYDNHKMMVIPDGYKFAYGRKGYKFDTPTKKLSEGQYADLGDTYYVKEIGKETGATFQKVDIVNDEIIKSIESVQESIDIKP